jgi:hypothetical protein
MWDVSSELFPSKEHAGSQVEDWTIRQLLCAKTMQDAESLSLAVWQDRTIVGSSDASICVLDIFEEHVTKTVLNCPQQSRRRGIRFGQFQKIPKQKGKLISISKRWGTNF